MSYKGYIALLSVILLSISTMAGELVSFKSHYGVVKSVQRLEKSLKANGFTVISKIDMDNWAKKSGMKLNKQITLIVGNPMTDTRILLEDARAGLDIPLRITVYKDFKNDTWIVYKKPQTYKDIYRLNHCVVLPDLDKKLQKSVKEAIALKIMKSEVKN